MTDPDLALPEYISDDEAARRYEAEPGFESDAFDALICSELPDTLKPAVLAWYRTTEEYTEQVGRVRDEAERPWV